MKLLELDLGVARTESRHPVGARQLVIAQADDEAELRAGELTADRIPALATLWLAAAEGETMEDIFVTNPAGSGRLVILAVR